MMKIDLIEAETISEFGGYSVDGVEFRGEEFELLVDEAKEIAYATGRNVIEVLKTLI